MALDVEGVVGRAELQATAAEHPETAPVLVDRREHALHQRPRRTITGGLAGPWVGVDHPALASLQLANALEQTLEQIHRFKAGDHDRHAMALGDRPVFLLPHHRADMARRQKPLHAALRRGEDRLHRRRHPPMANQQGKIAKTQAQGLMGQQGRGGCGGFKAHREEHHRSRRVGLGDGQDVGR